MADTVTTDGGAAADMTTETLFTSSTYEGDGVTSTVSPETVLNATEPRQLSHYENSNISTVFEVFIIIEIIMTTLELMVWIVAAIKISRWSKNYRNQMLLQLSLVRFIKRLVFLIVYLNDKGVLSESNELKTTLLSLGLYIDFVIVILVFFFIRHMYDSLILVLVKISENNLWKVLTCAWLLPIPISAACTFIIAKELLDMKTVYLLVGCLFRWPLMLVGTILYMTIVYRVLKDKIRRFARSLTIITFLMCLMINFYLFSKDIIELWCLKSFFTILISYISGFVMNFLILGFYVTLIMLNLRCNFKSSDSNANYSISNDK